jgi:hypothetical protein
MESKKLRSDYRIGPLYGKVSKGATMDYPVLVLPRKLSWRGIGGWR